MKKTLTSVIAALLLSANLVSAQSQTGIIKGKIQSEQGEPLPGITVSIQGTTIGSATNGKGIFVLQKVPAGTHTLVASGVGFKSQSQQVTVEAGQTYETAFNLSEDASALNEVVVHGERENYVKSVSSVGMRTETKLIETPQSIQVIPQQILRDQQVKTLNEAVKNAVGVSSVSPFSEFVFRGFTSWNSTMYNGINGALFPYNVQTPTYNIESIDFLRGPASVLYSTGRPGGVMNMNTKRPLDKERYEVNATYASWNDLSLNFDATGPLSKNKKLCYRIVGGARDAGSFRNFQETKFYTLASSISYQFTQKTKLVFEHNYFYHKQIPGFDNGTVLKMKADSTWDFKNMDVKFSAQDPDDYTLDKGHSGELSVSHNFTDNVKLTWLNRYVYNEGYASNHGSDYADPAVVNDTIHRWYGKWDYTWHNYQTNLFALIKFKTGKIKHQLLTGFDYNYQRQPSYHYTATAAPPLNVNNPDYSVDRPKEYQYTFDLPQYDYQYVTNAVYVQEQVDLNQYIKLSAAIRYDHYSFYWKYAYHDYSSDSVFHSDGESITAHAFIPRGGIVINPWKNIAFYYSYSQSFEPQWLNAVNRGGPFPPTKGKQHEVGYKGEFFKSRLFTGVSLYQIDYTNVLVADPSDTTGRRYLSVEGMRSKGIELNAQGNVSPNIQIMANYSYGTIKYFGDAVDGSWKKTDRQLNVPRTIWGLFVNYKFIDRALEGLGINAGVHHEGNRVASWFNQDFVTPAFTYLDAGLSYSYKKATVYFNVNNVTDVKYITGGYVTGLVYPGTPRNFRISINYVF